MGLAYIKGAKDADVISTVKHFPGHGNVDTDSHVGLPLVNSSIDELNKVELKPFKVAIDGGVDMIMTAHIEVPALDNTTAKSKKDGAEITLPATLSKKILTGELRDALGYKGVIVTDALNMSAISDNFGQVDAIEKTINAGADIPLMPVTIHETSDIAKFDTVFNQLAADANKGIISMDRINESVERIISLKVNRGIYNLDGTNTDTRTIDQKVADAVAAVGSAEHKAIEEEAANKAVTLVKNDNNILPFKMADGQNILCMAPYNNRAIGFVDETKNIASAKGFKNVTVDSIAYDGSTDLDEVTQAKIKAANYIILGSYSYDADSRSADADYVKYCNAVINFANDFGKPVAVVAIENPYEVDQMPNAKAFLAIYGYHYKRDGFSWQNIPAATRAIFGELNPAGKLPVAIPTADNKGILYPIGYGMSYGNIPIPIPGKDGFTITSTGKLNRTSGIEADVSVAPIEGAMISQNSQVVVFQLMKGTVPQSIVALKKNIVSSETLSAFFNVADFSNKDYSVKVFVLDSFNNDVSVPTSLAQPVQLQ